MVSVMSWLAAALAVITTAIAPPSEAAVSASSEAEAEALVQSGWWWSRESTSNHCTWPGVLCNNAGSVVTIYTPSYHMYHRRNEIKNMNFSCFPNLVRLRLNSSGLIGNIPPQIFGIPKLKYLDLSYNSLSGQLPSYIPRFNQLVELDISGNYEIHGSIPSEIGNLKELAVLKMSAIQLQGSVSSEIGNLKNLVELDLSHNRINGTIPQGIADLKKLVWLDLSHNRIIGTIPQGIGALQNLKWLHLDSNQLSGSIIPSLGKCSNLQVLDLSHNTLSGDIPFEQLSTLEQLINVDFSYNNLSGVIRFNCFYPDSWKFEGNKKLSGNHLSCPYNTSSTKISIYVIGLLVPIFVFLCIFFLAYFFLSHRKVKTTHVEATSNNNGDLFSVWNYDGQIAYQDIITATEDFDIRYCIGTGGLSGAAVVRGGLRSPDLLLPSSDGEGIETDAISLKLWRRIDRLPSSSLGEELEQMKRKMNCN